MKAAVSAYEQARLQYEKDVLQAFREVYDATVVFQSARANSRVKAEMEESSMKYITLANSQYINGVINYIDVLDAQRKYLSSQIEFSEARTRESCDSRTLQVSGRRLEVIAAELRQVNSWQSHVTLTLPAVVLLI